MTFDWNKIDAEEIKRRMRELRAKGNPNRWYRLSEEQKTKLGRKIAKYRWSSKENLKKAIKYSVKTWFM